MNITNGLLMKIYNSTITWSGSYQWFVPYRGYREYVCQNENHL